MKKLCVIIILGVLIFSFNALFAQEHQRPRPKLEEKTPRHQILMLMKLRMIEDLNLTEEQANQFFPKFNQWQDSKKEFGDKKKELFDKMQENIFTLEESDGKNKDAEEKLKQQLAQFKEMEKQFFQQHEQLSNEMMNALTLIQQAKFLIFREGFQEELRDTVRKVRENMDAAPEPGE